LIGFGSDRPFEMLLRLIESTQCQIDTGQLTDYGLGEIMIPTKSALPLVQSGLEGLSGF